MKAENMGYYDLRYNVELVCWEAISYDYEEEVICSAYARVDCANKAEQLGWIYYL